jgi:hypothetical protein
MLGPGVRRAAVTNDQEKKELVHVVARLLAMENGKVLVPVSMMKTALLLLRNRERTFLVDK